MYNDSYFLNLAVKLAKKGAGNVVPNPQVGAVIVKNGKIIGVGYHKKAGFPHAEREVLAVVSESPKGATLYVNLEPCSHFGKTPPCIDAIIQSGIKKVVFCTLDPNPLVHGKGREKLEQNGIETSVGLLEEKAKILNETFFTFHEKKRPFIAIKFAASLDGKIATKTHDSKWITNEKARCAARELRSDYQAILVGIGTVLQDDPHLGTRIKDKRDPVRIILDSSLKIPLTSQVLRDKNVIIATTQNADAEKKKQLEEKGIAIILFDTDLMSLKDVLRELYERNIISVLVEGGSQVLGSFVDEKLVDKVYAFYAPIIIGGENAIPAVGGLGSNSIAASLKFSSVSLKKYGDNFMISGSTKNIINP